MAEHDDLIDLERAGWQALSTSGDVATTFYGEVLAPRVVMLLPGGLVITDRQQAIESMGGVSWDGFDLSDERVHDLADTCAVVTYRSSARRGDQDYEALISSTYVLYGNRWRLAVHQQTPV